MCSATWSTNSITAAALISADDSQLLKRFRPRSQNSQKEAIKSLENGIDSIAQWMTSNKLNLNRDKTEFMVISSKPNTKEIVCDTLELSNETISASSSVRNLGVIMDKNMQMDDHINQIRKSAYYYLNWIRKIRPFLTKETTKSVVHALVISKVEYYNSLLVIYQPNITIAFKISFIARQD